MFLVSKKFLSSSLTSISFFISLWSIQRILYSFLNNRSLNHVDMEGMCVRKDNYNFHVDFPQHGGSVPQLWIAQGLMVRGNQKETNQKTYNNRCVYIYKNLYHYRSLGRIYIYSAHCLWISGVLDLIPLDMIASLSHRHHARPCTIELLLKKKNHFVNELTWLCSNKTLFTKIGGKLDLACGA